MCFLWKRPWRHIHPILLSHCCGPWWKSLCSQQAWGQKWVAWASAWSDRRESQHPGAATGHQIRWPVFRSGPQCLSYRWALWVNGGMEVSLGVGFEDAGGELSLGTGKEEGTSTPRHSFHAPSNRIITKRFRTAGRSTQLVFCKYGDLKF